MSLTSAMQSGVAGLVGLHRFLRTLDLSQKIFKRTDPSVAALPTRASDYIRRAVKFTPFPGEDEGDEDEGDSASDRRGHLRSKRGGMAPVAADTGGRPDRRHACSRG